MSFPSASSLYRFTKCPAYLCFKQNTGRPYRVQKAANRGTAIHAYLEDIAVGVPRTVALERVHKNYREECAKIKVAKLVPFGAKAEKAVVYNVYTGKAKIVGYGVGREYGELERGDIPGSGDLVWRLRRKKNIRDYKTGKGKVQAAAKNEQLLFLALCEHRLDGDKVVAAEIVYLSWGDGEPEYDKTEFTTMDFNAYAKVLREAYNKYEQYKDKHANGGGLEKTDVNKGTWCKYCDARAECPGIKHRKKKK